jgi:hypothetical protein
MKSRCLLAIAAVLLRAASLVAQQCPLPPAVQPTSPQTNMFSDQQESDLGDIMAESMAAEVIPVEDEALNAHLRQVSDRLIRYLPPNQFRFHFVLVELPEANAFSLSGGRVYVARKLVALTQNDDELAGVLAHELGHVVTHQFGINMTRRFRQVLGVDAVGDKADIAAKYHRLLETWRLKPVHAANEEEEHQYIADQVALFAMARAGYAPHAYVDLWDRFQQTHGKAGNWLTDLFGTPKPEQRRLREMLKAVSTMPAACTEIVPGGRTAEFEKWQADVVAYRASKSQESLPGLVSRQHLALPLRPDILRIHFSPDGKFIFAQDDGAIHVLTRDPFAFLFLIEAPDVRYVRFSSDSKSIVLYTDSLRVEVWDIASQKRTSVHELVLRDPCIQTSISPDGNFLLALPKAWISPSTMSRPAARSLPKSSFFSLLRFRIGARSPLEC